MRGKQLHLRLRPPPIRAVLRACYFRLEHRTGTLCPPTWLSPKLLERRGAASDLEMVARDGAAVVRRRRGPGIQGMPLAHLAPGRGGRQSGGRGFGRGVEVAVYGASAGMDEFRMFYFEEPWRYISPTCSRLQRSRASDRNPELRGAHIRHLVAFIPGQGQSPARSSQRPALPWTGAKSIVAIGRRQVGLKGYAWRDFVPRPEASRPEVTWR